MIKNGLDLSNSCVGRVVVSNGVDTVTAYNAVVYQGGDILAALAGGQSQYKFSYLYFEYENTSGSPSAGSVARTDTAATRQGVTTPYDLVRAPFVSNPVYNTTDGNHAANQTTFFAITSATTGLNGLPFTSGANSKIYAVCLVASPTGAASGDMLYARALLGTPLPVAGSGQVSGSYISYWI